MGLGVGMGYLFQPVDRQVALLISPFGSHVSWLTMESWSLGGNGPRARLSRFQNNYVHFPREPRDVPASCPPSCPPTDAISTIFEAPCSHITDKGQQQERLIADPAHVNTMEIWSGALQEVIVANEPL